MTTYTRHHPFYSAVKQRYSLVQPGSKKDTRHLVLDLTGSGITYEVGDCVAVFPVNPPPYVESVLHSLGSTGNELIVSRHTAEPVPFRLLLERHLNLSNIPRKLVELASDSSSELVHFLQPEQRHALKDFLSDREVWDFLETHPVKNIHSQQLVDVLQPLLPRFYSIASHQATVGEEIHLTVAHLHYSTHGYERWGICTHYLCNLVSLDEWSIPIYIQPHKGFTLPDNPAGDIIMVGPGTGVAPYVGFMQKRLWRKDTGRSWLFFGEWNQATDFFYKPFWKMLEEEEKLILSTAFSRDQAEKVYVQHRMLEKADELYQWIQEGATLFLCGNADHMAKDVEETLIEIIAAKGGISHNSAIGYLKELRHEKRYLKDVY